jgi:hypothetical protein
VADVDRVQRAQQLGPARFHRDARRLPADTLVVGDPQPGVQVGGQQPVESLAQQAGQGGRPA